MPSNSPDPVRMLPASQDSEEGVLASILLLPDRVLDLCLEMGVVADHFYVPAHQEIFRAMTEMRDRRIAIDIITLTQALNEKSVLPLVGGPAFITHLYTFLPTAANARYYLEIVLDRFFRREGIRVCTEYAARGYDPSENYEEWISGLERDVLAIRASKKSERKPIREIALQAIDVLQDRFENKGKLKGLSTGIKGLDNMTDGLHGGDYIVIAARPSMGKTAIGLNIAEAVALDQKQPIAIVTLEMRSIQLVNRLISSRARVSGDRMRTGMFLESDFPRMTAAASQIAGSGIEMIDDSPMTIQTLTALGRRLKREKGIKGMVIDYLQLLRSASKRAQDNRQLEISEISAGLKSMAGELDIWLVVLAQLNREAEKRTGHRPRLSDLRESGSLEQDADVVALLFREDYYAEGEIEKKEAEGKATLIVAKNRNGEVGDIDLTFLREFTRFEARTYSDPSESYPSI